MSEQKLKTPHALDMKACKQIATALNPLVADALVLYVKTKNYHWHLVGTHFRDYHLLFDEQAAQIFEMVDILAERVRKLGCPTLTSIGHASKLSHLDNDDQLGLKATEMLKRLMKDNLALTEHMRKAHAVCDRLSDCATTSILEVFLDETERRVWFLNAALQV